MQDKGKIGHDDKLRNAKISQRIKYKNEKFYQGVDSDRQGSW